MRYTVVWSQSAHARLAELWLASSDRRALTIAADEIDRRLARDPLRDSIAQGTRTRAIELPPLLVLFTIDDGDMKVLVERVHELGPLP
jgi:hypothetical protein